MPDARDHRHGAFDNHAGKKLVVERHEILVRPAAAHHEHHFGAGVNDGAHAFDDAGRSLRTLHRHTREQHPRHGETAAQGAQHIVHRIAARARDQADGKRIGGQGQFSRRVRKAFGGKLPRKVGHLQSQLALSHRREREHVEVHAPLRRVQGEPARQFHQLPDGHLHACGAEAVVPHHAGKACRLVLDREVHGLVPGLVRQLGDLADQAHRHALERPLRQLHGGGYRQSTRSRRIRCRAPAGRSGVRARRLTRAESSSARTRRLFGVSRRRTGTPRASKSAAGSPCGAVI